MKNLQILKIFVVLAACLSALVLCTGCDSDDGPNDSLQILVDGKNETELFFPSIGGEQRVIVTSSGDWKLDNDYEPWFDVSISPRTADGSQVLTVKTLLNGATPRQTQLELVASTNIKALIKISQEGSDKDYKTVAELRNLYEEGESNSIGSEIWVNASVISNFRSAENGGLNNASDTRLIVSDETAGIEILLEESNTAWALGDEITVSLYGQKLARSSSGILQIRGAQGGIPVANIHKIGSKQISPVNISLAEAMSGNYESRYVSFDNVQVIEKFRAGSFVENGVDTNVTFENTVGNHFDVFTGRGATFATVTIPDGSGTIKGIFNTYDGVGELVFTSTGDFSGLTKERFRSVDNPKRFEVTPLNMTVSQWEGSSQLEIITDDDVQWSVTSSNTSVFTIEPSSGTGPRMVTLSYGANPSTTDTRTTVLTFVTTDEWVPATERVKAVLVTQSVIKSFSLSRYELRVSNQGTTMNFNINGAVAWKAESDHDDFVLGVTSGTGTTTNTVSYTSNHKPEDRVATITVSTDDEDIPADERVLKFVINQAGTTPFVVSPTDVTIVGDAGETVITANGWWDAESSDPENFMMDKWEGYGSGKLQFTENPSTSETRTATMTFTSQSTTLLPEDRVKVVTITQLPRKVVSYGEEGKPGEVGRPEDGNIEF